MTQPETNTPPQSQAPTRRWICVNCGYIYDQAKGDPDGGVAPGTAWEDIPEHWRCPDCGAEKADFEMVEL
jgi:rubredoxin